MEAVRGGDGHGIRGRFTEESIDICATTLYPPSLLARPQ